MKFSFQNPFRNLDLSNKVKSIVNTVNTVIRETINDANEKINNLIRPSPTPPPQRERNLQNHLLPLPQRNPTYKPLPKKPFFKPIKYEVESQKPVNSSVIHDYIMEKGIEDSPLELNKTFRIEAKFQIKGLSKLRNRVYYETRIYRELKTFTSTTTMYNFLEDLIERVSKMLRVSEQEIIDIYYINLNESDLEGQTTEAENVEQIALYNSSAPIVVNEMISDQNLKFDIGTCVDSALLKRHQDLYQKNRRSLKTLRHKSLTPLQVVQNSLNPDKKEGYNLIDIVSYCKTFQQRLICVDGNTNEIIKFYDPEKKFSQAPFLLIYVKNGHLYFIDQKYAQTLSFQAKTGRKLEKRKQYPVIDEKVCMFPNLSVDEIFNSPSLNYFISDPNLDLTNYLVEIYEKFNILPECRYSKGEIQYLLIKTKDQEKRIFFNSSPGVVNMTCDIFGIDFKNQTTTKAAIDVYQKMFSEVDENNKRVLKVKEHKSIFNNNVKEVFEKCLKVCPITRSFKEYPKSLENCITYDFSLHYVSCVLEMDYLLRFCALDEFKTIRGTGFEDFRFDDGSLDISENYHENIDVLTRSIVFLETKNSYPLRGNGLYFGEELLEVIKYNWKVKKEQSRWSIDLNRKLPIEYTLTHYITGDFVANHFRDYFVKFIDKLEELENKKEITFEEKKDIVKSVLLPFIGVLNRDCVYNNEEFFITSNIDEAILHKDKYDSFVKEYDTKRGKLYIVMKSDEVKNNDITGHIVYSQILSHANRKVWKLYQEIGGDIIHIQTDSITVVKDETYNGLKSAISVDGIEVQTSYKLGKWLGCLKEEKVIRKKTPIMPEWYWRKRPQLNLLDEFPDIIPDFGVKQLRFDTPEYDNEFNTEKIADHIIGLNRCIVSGIGGSGKTYLAKHVRTKLEEIYKDDIKSVCFTNKACCMLGGKAITFHKFFKMAGFQQTYPNSIPQYEIKCLFLDEISAMDIKFFNLFYLYIKNHPDMKVFIFGDYDQCPPVSLEELNWRDQLRLDELVNFNKVELQINKRSDDVIFNLSKDILNPEVKANVSPFDYVPEKTWDFITWRNDANKDFNKKLEGIAIKNHWETLDYPEKVMVKENEIFKGMWFLSLYTSKTLPIHKNDIMILSKITKSKVFLQKKASESDKPEGDLYEFSKSELFKKMRYYYVKSVHSTQGDTIYHHLAIFESYFMTPRVFYTGVLRPSDKKYLHIVPKDHPWVSDLKAPMRESEAETRCKTILEDYFPDKNFEKIRIEDEHYEFELDVYSEELQLALEFNGRQHYHYDSYFHNSLKEFETNQKRDKHKVRYCEEKGILLIVVPYTEKNNLQEFIKEKLNEEFFVEKML